MQSLFPILSFVQLIKSLGAVTTCSTSVAPPAEPFATGA
eukprot:CAMPEP_0173409920 /NCGR_PEP_ID=MMETSP1356-20130122/73363_1 /TAXON_ID=77927 ORGANISM="Hemiselmis virescens, Strain PCC157" /NCGR_SAMPLE_ID=MMETSP1356 /ASSEMBLY_ACC=CAM_ASM_000847 /LENGTH=38 /DNA_ID= /DNA_START= /DNA_END= /DNA_ORIENTATION=